MSEPARRPDAIDEPSSSFWEPQTLERLMAGKQPFTSWAQLDIPDLTDEEREAFARALDDE